jgi:hypothetical protein
MGSAPEPGLAAFVFVVTAIADVVWAKYTKHVAYHNPGRAAAWAGAIGLLGITVGAYVESRWYVPVAALGMAAGTYVAVRHSRRVAGREEGA